ncbi:nuclear transport factor 2 family protein [Nocardiopsis lambiniae]|uniref:Nuclear transport factor 2 family protein n=1 Tax=Nocardiopsis lambiniae TaxID=3075539 RepID=A0ABU2M7Y7_9ACTN|nr:nuclear transport factor 2 family protein [Nocardiopsis sp. DSM 44743]MDT0328086.1 nuclear transport factor 2 family protein [Nocardiopsis sp. DSM 44743]
MTVTDTVRVPFPAVPARAGLDDPASLDARVREVYARVDAGDIEGLLELFSDDVVYDRPGYPSIVGRDAFERFYRQARVIREGTHTPESVVVGADGVAVQGRFEGVLKNGRSVSLRYADFFGTAPDGRFRRRDTYFFSPMV